MQFRFLAFLVVIAAAGCDRPVVEWGDTTYLGSPPLGVNETAAATSLAVSCRTSVTSAPLPGGGEIAVWWDVRKDSSALLRTARRERESWLPAMTIDSADVGRRGCGRPSPAITSDSATGSVHIGYFLEPAAGAGVFFAHSMDDGKTFHSPVPIVFGRRPSTVSVDADGERVALAYEEPNGQRPRVFLALSRTMGHIFEERMPISGGNAAATQPTVTVRGDRLAVQWLERAASAAAEAQLATRIGIWK